MVPEFTTSCIELRVSGYKRFVFRLRDSKFVQDVRCSAEVQGEKPVEVSRIVEIRSERDANACVGKDEAHIRTVPVMPRCVHDSEACLHQRMHWFKTSILYSHSAIVLRKHVKV